MRIVLSRTDRIGDLILSTPAIATVRKSFPEAHITMVCSPYNAVVMQRSPDVDEVLEVPRGVRPAAFGSRLQGTDAAIALAPRAADLALVGATRARVRVGYTYVRRYAARLTARFYVNRLMLSEADPDLCERDPGRRVRHEVEQLLDLIALAGARDRVETLRLSLTDEDRRAVAGLPPAPVVVHLAPRWFVDGSSRESTALFLDALAARLRPVVVTCAADVEETAVQLVGAHPGMVLAAGLSFHQWAAAFERAAVVVTVDTGATHVASAVRRPTVVLFEHRYFNLNSQEWAPYRVPSVLVRKPSDTSRDSQRRLCARLVEAVDELEHA